MAAASTPSSTVAHAPDSIGPKAQPHDVNEQTAIDMKRFRARCTFDIAKMHNMIDEGSRDTEMRQKVHDIIANDALITEAKRTRPFLSRADRLYTGQALMKRLFDLVDEHDLDYMEFLECLFLVDEQTSYYLHHVAFLPVINAQGSDEQQAEWMAKAQNHAWLGCYLQTELGHGSNVRRLETTATFCKDTDEFEIHSPSLTATKWWIGGLGVVSTHGVVQAQLIIDGTNHGPHLFLVQLRDIQNHKLLPGIIAGEIGPKAHGGFAALDNGYARFNHVRIPRFNMLARFSQVTREGNFIKPPSDKLSFGGMVFIRAQMISAVSMSLTKATTIATRYLHVRRQFADPEAKGERAEEELNVIFYPSVYMRLLPLIAKSYVFGAMGKDMAELYGTMASQLASGNTEMLAEVHAVSSGLKSYVTAEVVEGIEIARRSLGGHGFMESAGVARIYSKELPSVTYEGDNYVLAQQTCRGGLKTYRGLLKDASKRKLLTASTDYLAHLADKKQIKLPHSIEEWRNLQVQTDLLDARAAFHVKRLEILMRSKAEGGQGKTMGQLSWQCQMISKAIVESFIGRRVAAALAPEGLLVNGLDDAGVKVIKNLMNFYLLNTIDGALSELLEFGVIPAHSTDSGAMQSPIETLRLAIANAAQEVLPETIGLTDAFGFSDWDLNSALGRYDGRCYEDLLHRAESQAELNLGGKIKDIFEKSIKPVLERGDRLAKL
ncbi:uncharacterized protein L969DRAFT_84418 [Mixia osmundae IAM 14324]|uniref:Acyl-coenzyme A oxidase n=1 Tax=Mixia osmundae (strain CBS 9802 / IAM 14324 / JCM 22182 / KY 12970) TaxID=764103 RepID=G7E2X9_MIXOS|nr:uncharacterized protein L969DRAFT_84418 [Mixia osmundae IAM 14324]KEI42552.1 hypothetical protein L969DRAFT_84418 [Mixia osmundae IAM 14324]GAA97160.1 hypothetical protein E5Q_03836 [Mixia osmundae IAM 14324]